MIDQNVETWLRRVSRSMLGEYETLVATFELAKSLIARGVPGDFVEAGVYAGAEIAVMAKAIVLAGAEGRGRRVHVFDSFQGIPEPGPEDLEFLGVHHKGGACCPQHSVMRNLSDWGLPEDLFVWHPGWFTDTMPTTNVGPIALLRIDCDLYESMQPCMQYLHPKLSVGGWEIIDDYPLSGCRKAMHEHVMPQPIYFQKVR